MRCSREASRHESLPPRHFPARPAARPILERDVLGGRCHPRSVATLAGAGRLSHRAIRRARRASAARKWSARAESSRSGTLVPIPADYSLVSRRWSYGVFPMSPAQYLMRTYQRLPLRFTHGRGMRLWDEQGNEYLDAIAGIAVTNLGHAHPEIAEAIPDQATRLLHTSNLFEIEWQEKLGQR